MYLSVAGRVWRYIQACTALPGTLVVVFYIYEAVGLLEFSPVLETQRIEEAGNNCITQCTE